MTYRIKTIIDSCSTRYMLQKRLFWWWYNVNEVGNRSGMFETFREAEQAYNDRTGKLLKYTDVK